MSDSWRSVLDPPAGSIRPGDAAGLGPPPRELSDAHRKYVKVMKRSLTPMWVFFAVLFLPIGAGLFFVMPSIATVPWIGIVTTVLAVRGVRRDRAARAWLTAVLREGSLRMAYVDSVRQIPVGRRTIMGQKYRHDATFDVDGRKVFLSAMNDAMSLLPVGTVVEVLYHADYPGEIIPTFLLM
jgi:hypothetical protein